jgi:hypothetical protein
VAGWRLRLKRAGSEPSVKALMGERRYGPQHKAKPAASLEARLRAGAGSAEPPKLLAVRRGGKEARGVTLHRGTRIAYEAGRTGRACSRRRSPSPSTGPSRRRERAQGGLVVLIRGGLPGCRLCCRCRRADGPRCKAGLTGQKSAEVVVPAGLGREGPNVGRARLPCADCRCSS